VTSHIWSLEIARPFAGTVYRSFVALIATEQMSGELIKLINSNNQMTYQR